MENTFRKELTDLINKHSKENTSDTPDHILAHYIEKSLDAFDHATNSRSEYYNAGNETPRLDLATKGD